MITVSVESSSYPLQAHQLLAGHAYLDEGGNVVVGIVPVQCRAGEAERFDPESDVMVAVCIRGNYFVALSSPVRFREVDITVTATPK